VPRAAARASDRLLEFLVVAFAGWTAIYHVCLVARIGSGWAAAAGLTALALAGWFVRARDGAPLAVDAAPRMLPPRRALLALNAALAVAAAAAFGLTRIPYFAIWLLWLAAAACSLAWCTRPRATGIPEAVPAAGPPEPATHWSEIAVVAAWALGLAVLSLLVRDPDPDDAFYVHFAAWIAAHGQFPTRDVVYSDQLFPALYYPPVFSYEALTGTISRLSGLSVANLQYLVVTPAGAVLSVLATWRLLRAWRVPMVALALTATLVFLIFDAAHHMTFGAFFVNRMWQGKVLLLAVLVPLLLALLHDYGDRPQRGRLALLFAAGAAAVGLSTTAIFLVPVIAGGSLLGLLLRRPSAAAARTALLGFAATCAYPLVAGAVTKLSSGRTPDVYTAADVIPSTLVHFVLGTGGFAMLGLAAVLLGPSLLPRASAGPMLAGTALLVGVLVSPRVPQHIFHLTGLGRVLWRLIWALPAAALVGALAVSIAGVRGPGWLRAVPALALCVALALFGEPLWARNVGSTLAHRPVLKRTGHQIADAHMVLPHTRPGDLVLAPTGLSQTLLVLSGQITTVSPRPFFTRALAAAPGMHAAARLRLQRFAQLGIGPPPALPARAPQLRGDLRLLGVDLVCLGRPNVTGRAMLRTLGWRPVAHTHHTGCSRAPEPSVASTR
jgi:hypothetical protein